MNASIIYKGWGVCRSLAVFFALSLIITGCSPSAGVGTGGTGIFSGIANLDLTDTPDIDYAHVYVTVTGVAFHSDTTAAFSSYSTGKAAGWQIISLPNPKTIDLAQLTNGTMYADLNGNASLFSGMTMPVGSYQQIRIFLASTENAYVGTVPGLVYNNEVQLNGDSSHYPLRIPSAGEGIRVVPESPVMVTSGGSTSLALDFNLNDDIVEVFPPNSSTEFILKPRLGYFDMGRVGCIKGAVGFSNLSTSGIEVKAEQVDSGGTYRTVRRITSVDGTTGQFNLYPLPVFGNATTAAYDVLIRGRNIQTAIVRNITVHIGTTKANGVDLGTIALQSGTEFNAQLASGMHPTGAWFTFYQTVAADSVPFEVRYRHLDPYRGIFGTPVNLSNGPVQVASFPLGVPLVFKADNSSQGLFSAVADAANLYTSGTAISGVTAATGQTVSIIMSAANNPQVVSGGINGNIKCSFDMALLGSGLGPGMGMGKAGIGYPTKGQLFITNGGMIIDSLGALNSDTTVAAALQAGGGPGNPVVLADVPSDVAGAVYGIYALGWGNGFLSAGDTLGVDLRNGNATATINMK